MGQEMSRTRMFQTMIMMSQIQSLSVLIGIPVTPLLLTGEHGLTGLQAILSLKVISLSIHLRLLALK